MKSRTPPKRAAAAASPATKSAPVRRPRARKTTATTKPSTESAENAASPSDVFVPSTEAAAPTLTSSVSSEQIAHRAYELFVDAGAVHGRDLDHWLAAERELKGGN